MQAAPYRKEAEELIRRLFGVPGEMMPSVRIDWHATLAAGQHLYYQADGIDDYHIVLAGSLKMYRVSNGGDESVIGFRLPGQVLWRESPQSVVALEESVVCSLSWPQLQRLLEHPETGRQCFRILSREIREKRNLVNVLAHGTAKGRVAYLLCWLWRQQDTGDHADLFRIPMLRADIASLLGLSVETVSRVITRLQQDGIIELKSRNAKVLDKARLQTLIGDSCPRQLAFAVPCLGEEAAA